LGNGRPSSSRGSQKAWFHRGATGRISFDQKGDRKSVLYTTYIIKDGKFMPYHGV
jgi:ABC-type branched-subunit amino acid transport system substrate-binding protein